MATHDSRSALWHSVSALMLKRWGAVHLSRLAKEADIGLATCSRMKAQETSIGLEVVDKIATAFGVDPWELLVPGFNPDNRPTLQPLTQAEIDLYKRIAAAIKST